jgi:hypothetical protein
VLFQQSADETGLLVTRNRWQNTLRNKRSELLVPFAVAEYKQMIVSESFQRESLNVSQRSEQDATAQLEIVIAISNRPTRRKQF